MLRTPNQMGRRHAPHTLQNRTHKRPFKLPSLRKHMTPITTIITNRLCILSPNRNYHILKRNRLMVPIKQQNRIHIQIKNINRQNPSKILFRQTR
ncbi:hypothetical protein HanRHA438_Chr14g0664041 [Helianthus annuus]|nr:hypothetical protein HanIR_Chr14g0708791 [Helianthus annuus]KAJ0854572.1 hypothetical protein HanRHA438_Chr14g0664041 [Helianthus annuus]